MKSKLLSLFLSFFLLSCILQSAQAQEQKQYPVYIIQPGDTLSQVADRFDIRLDDLLLFNNISNADTVGVGTAIYIPGFEGISMTLVTAPVQLGESLNGETQKYPVDRNTLVKLNHLTSPGEIYAGLNLILPLTDESTSKSLVAKVDSTLTLLETSALQNTSTWDILEQNHFNRQSSLVPQDLLYLYTKEMVSQISSVEPQLNSITISPLPLVQGNTFEIIVDSPSPVELSGSLNGMPLHFFTLDGNKQIALQGIYAEAETGLAPFVLSGTFGDGRTFNIQQSILLESGNFTESEPLYVDPSTIDPAVTKPEDDLIASYTSKVTNERYWSGFFHQPGTYYDFTAYFGEKRTYNDGAYKSFHTGVDFAGGYGLPIYAAGGGVVVYTGELTVRGKATIIDHGWGVYTAYYHQSEIKVNVGDSVTAGQEIGVVGNSGRVNDANAFENAGSHLHWEVWVNGIQVDPLQWLDQEFPYEP